MCMHSSASIVADRQLNTEIYIIYGYRKPIAGNRVASRHFLLITSYYQPLLQYTEMWKAGYLQYYMLSYLHIRLPTIFCKFWTLDMLNIFKEILN